MEEGGGLRAAMRALTAGGASGPEARATSADDHGGGRRTASGHWGRGDGQTAMEEGGRQTLEAGGQRGVPRRRAASKAVADWASRIVGGDGARGPRVGRVRELHGDGRSNGDGGPRRRR
jgi:hypothetical protein